MDYPQINRKRPIQQNRMQILVRNMLTEKKLMHSNVTLQALLRICRVSAAKSAITVFFFCGFWLPYWRKWAAFPQLRSIARRFHAFFKNLLHIAAYCNMLHIFRTQICCGKSATYRFHVKALLYAIPGLWAAVMVVNSSVCHCCYSRRKTFSSYNLTSHSLKYHSSLLCVFFVFLFI